LSASFSLALTNVVIGRVDDGGLSVLIVIHNSNGFD
jgi:hypothetical protein